ncbi:HAD family hydrolase [archaeon]|nr:HAD family hydrolase [archaeon]
MIVTVFVPIMYSYIKHIIFDLDGVLIDSRELHYDALNKALQDISEKYVINREEHLSTYDGKSTKTKLDLLTERKGLSVSLHDKIWKLKQTYTKELLQSTKENLELKRIFSHLKNNSIKISVASNAVRHTIITSLHKLGILNYCDYILSNEDVFLSKPNAEIYLRCMINTKTNPDETIIVEDSHTGRKGALRSGATLCPVKDSSDTTYDYITNFIKNIDLNMQEIKPKWQGGNMNVLIPMAGAGSRFEKAGYTFPKPLIDVDGKPMIQTVVENINIQANYIFIVQKSHYEKYNLETVLNNIAPNCKIVQVDGITEGAACTTLLAKEFIDNDEPLVMANSDQFVEWDSNEFMYSMIGDNIDGGILTFESTHPKWSYAKLDNDGFVSEVAEKNPISNIATVGIYYWRRGSDYVKYAEQMIDNNIRVNNEFYVCPVFNEAIGDNKKIKIYNIDKMWGLGTPEDLKYFIENNNHSRRRLDAYGI